MSMKNSNDTIGNRTRDLTACSAVPQPIEPPIKGLVYKTLKEYNCIAKNRLFNIFYTTLLIETYRGL
jgi:hypothetical protein